MSPTLRLLPDYQCSPLWDHESGDNLDPAGLGLPSELVARVMAWDSAYQQTLDHDYPPDSDFPTPAAREAWREEGDAIIVALRGLGFEIIDRR